MWTENWTGWFQDWGQSKPHRPVEDIAYATLLKISDLHDSFLILNIGNIRQPKWGHLEQLHNAIKVMEKVLVYGVANTTNLGAGLTVTKYIANGISDGCFLINANQSTDTNLTYNGKIYFVPSKSISVLPNCEKEVYNTAKVNAPTTLIVTKPTESIFNWQWRPETLTTIHEKGSFSNNSLLEQILTTGDTSDFLWYMTRIDLNKFRQYWSKKMKLHVNTKGHIIHAFVNKHFIGSQYAVNGVYEFVFEHTTKMRKGHNYIALLSSTNGLANYGAYFDLQRAGIDGGPVNLIGYGNATINLTSNTWTYKIGLNGEDEKLYLPSQQHSIKWFSGHLPINRPLIWYKTIFEVPEGNDALVLDLQGMGKGYAWVNGHSIGRYWPSFIADDEGCGPCDYRHEYDSNRCRTDCGKPSQRWYHVPRYFTIKGPNTLILFEEFGGDISKISLQKVSSGSSSGDPSSAGFDTSSSDPIGLGFPSLLIVDLRIRGIFGTLLHGFDRVVRHLLETRATPFQELDRVPVNASSPATESLSLSAATFAALAEAFSLLCCHRPKPGRPANGQRHCFSYEASSRFNEGRTFETPLLFAEPSSPGDRVSSHALVPVNASSPATESLSLSAATFAALADAFSLLCCHRPKPGRPANGQRHCFSYEASSRFNEGRTFETPLLFGIKRKSFVFTKTVLGSGSFWRNFRLGFICLGYWQFNFAPTVDLQKQRFQSDLDKL
ncbi:hypothetical protein ZIOFF_029781 [Zingiber officinale]|uniref:beta-galactosidase n=1 Tax=Zingiber officinale TaxID=94328 RepID=A0A8J5GZ29_ZINOF|nr:hypothetical protein ZIOFF_029781 [Zingiber officinale]